MVPRLMPDDPCGSPEARQFDFWLGEWNLTWPAEQMGGTEGELGTGTNRIRRLFGECAIEEEFSTSDASFQGRSLSVFDPRAGLWRQTWVDSSGGYLSFTGDFDGEQMELRTQPEERVDEIIVQRMVFSDIEADALHWSWQGSRDGGQSWNDLWNIEYQRMG